MEMPEESSWTQHDNTMLTKNNAFGKITFDVEVSTKKQKERPFFRCFGGLLLSKIVQFAF